MAHYLSTFHLLNRSLDRLTNVKVILNVLQCGILWKLIENPPNVFFRSAHDSDFRYRYCEPFAYGLLNLEPRTLAHAAVPGLPWQCLYFFPLPQGQGSLRPTRWPVLRIGSILPLPSLWLFSTAWRCSSLAP
jgi:hypothetical protein